MKIGNLNVYGIIYKVTNKINGKVYIGQTIDTFKRRYHSKGGNTLIERMYNTYIYNKNNNKSYNDHLLNSIEKYGFNNFDVVDIFDIAFSREELDIKEKSWISIYKSTDKKYGYNILEGGTVGYTYTEEVKSKMKEAKEGIYFGKDNPFYGKHHSEEQKAKWSKQRKGRKLSEEWKKNIGKSQQKKVINLDTGLIFNSIKEATEE